MPQSQIARALFPLSAAFQIVGTLTADFFSKSHIFNDAWPAHAKFHTGQTISFSITLALSGLYFAFRSSPQGLSLDDITTATLLLNLYWITQFMAFFFQGSHWCDPPFCHETRFPPQWSIEAFAVTLNFVAWWTERNALNMMKKEKEQETVGAGREKVS